MTREIICLTHHTWIEGMCNYGGDLACRDCTEQRIKQLEEIIELYESHIEAYFGKSCVERLREKTKKELEG